MTTNSIRVFFSFYKPFSPPYNYLVFLVANFFGGDKTKGDKLGGGAYGSDFGGGYKGVVGGGTGGHEGGDLRFRVPSTYASDDLIDRLFLETYFGTTCSITFIFCATSPPCRSNIVSS